MQEVGIRRVIRLFTKAMPTLYKKQNKNWVTGKSKAWGKYSGPVTKSLKMKKGLPTSYKGWKIFNTFRIALMSSFIIFFFYFYSSTKRKSERSLCLQKTKTITNAAEATMITSQTLFSSYNDRIKFELTQYNQTTSPFF